jgi:murein DD-endopeptidase MepM/ murein hydrolase activator NlpD
VEVGRVSSAFGPRTLPGEVQKMHQGVDIWAPPGTEVRAASAGTVVDVSPDGVRTGYGNTVIVEHPDGTLTLYAHLQRFGAGIQVGAVVERGDVLGYVGATHAPSTSPMVAHLHFEVLKKKVLSQGRVVVNQTTPSRYEPQAWLRSRNVMVA